MTDRQPPLHAHRTDGDAPLDQPPATIGGDDQGAVLAAIQRIQPSFTGFRPLEFDPGSRESEAKPADLPKPGNAAVNSATALESRPRQEAADGVSSSDFVTTGKLKPWIRRVSIVGAIVFAALVGHFLPIERSLIKPTPLPPMSQDSMAPLEPHGVAEEHAAALPQAVRDEAHPIATALAPQDLSPVRSGQLQLSTAQRAQATSSVYASANDIPPRSQSSARRANAQALPDTVRAALPAPPISSHALASRPAETSPPVAGRAPLPQVSAEGRQRYAAAAESYRSADACYRDLVGDVSRAYGARWANAALNEHLSRRIRSLYERLGTLASARDAFTNVGIDGSFQMRQFEYQIREYVDQCVALRGALDEGRR